MIQIANNTVRVKQLNVELVKATLKNLTYGTKLTISNVTGLSVATCGSILNELLVRGEVIEMDFEEPKGGRPARRFMYNANFSLIACMYISAVDESFQVTYVITNMIGELLESRCTRLNAINYEAIELLIDGLVSNHESIKAIGIGIPGVIYRDVVRVKEVKELTEFPLGTRLKEKFNLGIAIENDMNLTSYGFYQKKEFEKDKTIAVVAFPKGKCPGSGIIVDGRILKGNTNFAGEVSLMPFNQNEIREQGDFTATPLSVVVNTIISIIVIVNPEIIVITGDSVQPEMKPDIRDGCIRVISEEHMPELLIQENMHDEYINGLISMTLETLTCDVELVEKKI